MKGVLNLCIFNWKRLVLSLLKVGLLSSLTLDNLPKGFFYTLGISDWCPDCCPSSWAHLWASELYSQQGSSLHLTCLCRNLPEHTLLVQLMVVFYGISILTDGHVMIPISLTAILCGGYTGAYISEIIRQVLEAVPKGQTKRLCLKGFTYADTMRIIILPQAVRTILPPLTNQVVNLIKNTSTVAIISGADIMFTAKAWAMIPLTMCRPSLGLPSSTLSSVSLATLARRKEEENKKAY